MNFTQKIVFITKEEIAAVEFTPGSSPSYGVWYPASFKIFLKAGGIITITEEEKTAFETMKKVLEEVNA